VGRDIVTTPEGAPQVFDQIMNDVKAAIVDAQVEIVAQYVRAGSAGGAESYVKWLTPKRLPSRGGGSYNQRHHAVMSNKGYAESTGTCVGEVWNDHPYAQAVEFGTSSHKQVAKGRAMRITNVIPGYYKGRNINTVPYGVKYERKKPPLEVLKVDHPGGRPFYIYRDTFKHMNAKLVRIIKKALKEAFI